MMMLDQITRVAQRGFPASGFDVVVAGAGVNPIYPERVEASS